MSIRLPVQTSLDELASLGELGSLDEPRTPLREVTFVVVDLETTGGSPADNAITEIGAVKVRGGERLGEFQTLVNPGRPIPAFIAVLTGITDSMVAAAPPIGAVLPAFWEFARGSVLVAHNAGFDLAFLRAAGDRLAIPWPQPRVVDTVHLARQLVDRFEARNRKLATLARLFGSATTPDHRALTDARATVDVLHGLLGRVGNLGVHTLEDLRTFTRRVPPAVRRKRHLADDVPPGPGVYSFLDDAGRVLYVGTSVDLRTRVRSYFTAGERRRRMAEMVALAASVRSVPCATALEARVRELRLIAEHAPPYNRRSRRPDQAPWVKLTVEAFPRLSVVRRVLDDGAPYVGPFSSAGQAKLAVDALHEAFRLRQCTGRLPARPRPDATACLLAELGRCGAPCVGGQSPAEYAEIAAAAATAMQADAEPVVSAVLGRAERLSGTQRYEEAAVSRDRLRAFLAGSARLQRIAPLAASPEVLAARRVPPGGWELVLVRYGRLAGTAVSPPRASPWPHIEALRATGEVVQPGLLPQPAASHEETEQVLQWLEQPGVRLVSLDGSWACPVRGAAGALARLGTLAERRWSA